jgi:hypothetical protein
MRVRRHIFITGFQIRAPQNRPLSEDIGKLYPGDQRPFSLNTIIKAGRAGGECGYNGKDTNQSE